MKFIIAAAVHYAVLASAACTDIANGFASLNGGTKGGLGGTEVVVNNLDDLKKYASASGSHVIKVQGTITVTPFGSEIKVTSDKTIIGLGASATIDQGGFGMNGAKNVIIRNLRIGRCSSRFRCG
jgi:pectate lyase